jgi:hypothetical protein
MVIWLQDVQEVLTSLLEQINKLRLEVNEKKTKFMIVSRKPCSGYEYVKIDTRNFEIVKDYYYLFTNIKNKLRPKIETKNCKYKYYRAEKRSIRHE